MDNIAGIALVIFSFMVSNVDDEAGIFDRPWKFYFGVAAPCVLGLTVVNLLGGLEKLKYPERV